MKSEHRPCKRDAIDREKKINFRCTKEVYISIFRLSILSFFFLAKSRTDRYRIDASDGMLHNGERITKYYVGALKKKKRSNKSQLLWIIALSFNFLVKFFLFELETVN